MELVGLLSVTRVVSLTPRMKRVSFRAPDGFVGWPDQQLKLCFPRASQEMPLLPASSGDDMRWYQEFLAIPEDTRPWMRGFTVRAFSPSRAELDIDFVLHGDSGPATRWALTAAPGQVLGRYGPSEIYRRPLAAGDWYLFAGDETALPAIGTLLESLPSARTVGFVEVHDAGEEQPLPAVRWLHRSRGESLLAAVRAATFPPGSVSVWLAGEAGVVRALRRHLVADRGIPKNRIDFAGYWRRRLTQDDAPTAEDLAEAQERVAQAAEG
jgi:NADPH-dependent ferric siderophore reductase